MSEKKYYYYSQNNSGGRCIAINVNGVDGHHFYVEAESIEMADRIFGLSVGFYHPYCSCCGERFREILGWHEEPDGYIILGRNDFEVAVSKLPDRAKWLMCDGEAYVLLTENGLKSEVLYRYEKS